MQRPLPAVLVHLPDGHVGNDAGDRDVHARVLEGQAIDIGIAALDEEVRRERFIRSRSLLRSGIERQERGTEGDDRKEAASCESHAGQESNLIAGSRTPGLWAGVT